MEGRERKERTDEGRDGEGGEGSERKEREDEGRDGEVREVEEGEMSEKAFSFLQVSRRKDDFYNGAEKKRCKCKKASWIDYALYNF